MNAKATDDGFKPPYISFRTLLHLVEKMADNGIPPRIDRSYLSGSEGAKTQVLAACRTLGLIRGEKNEVTDLLKELVNNSSGRGAMVKAMLEEHFPEPVRLGTINATQGQLEDAFRAYGISGDTMRKAIAFYLKAAEFAGVPTSTNFRTPKIQRADGSPARAKQKAKSNDSSKNTRERDPDPALPGVKLTGVHPALAGILADLPGQGQGWTAQRRDGFMATFKAVVEYAIPVVDEEPDVEYDDSDEYEEETADELGED